MLVIIQLYKKCIKSKKPAFSLAEALVSLILISVTLSLTLPIFTRLATTQQGIDQASMACIMSGAAGIPYNATTGNVTMPASGTTCYTSVTGCQYNSGYACNTLTKYANLGSSAQQTAAKIILRTACDQGSAVACNYFINNCIQNGSTTSPYCHVPGYLDVTYYLTQPYTSSTASSAGTQYVVGKIASLLNQLNPVLLNETSNDCSSNTSDEACTIYNPNGIYIQNCNNNISSSCQYAYNNNLNRSCYQVKSVWPNASSGTYMLTPNGYSSPVQTTCNMSSLASAAITGCDAGNAVDCAYGYNNNYNQTCNQIATNWSLSIAGTYNLTTSSAGAYTATACTSTMMCNQTPEGNKCPTDGTVYVGLYNGYYYYTTPTDAGGTSAQFYWNNGATTWTTTGATDLNNGINNYNILLVLNTAYYGGTGTDAGAPYGAEGACITQNTTNFLGHTDWYLPSLNELNFMYLNKSNLQNLTSPYWSSSETGNVYATHFECFSGGQMDDSCSFGANKNANLHARCVRRTT